MTNVITKVKGLNTIVAPEGYKFVGSSNAYWQFADTAKKAYEGAKWTCNKKQQPVSVIQIPDIEGVEVWQGGSVSLPQGVDPTDYPHFKVVARLWC